MFNKENNILKNIMQIRLLKKLTQKHVSSKLGISEATYNRIESGKIALSYEHLANIASVFEVRVIDIITYPKVYVPGIDTSTTKVLIEIDISTDDFIKMGLKDKFIKILSK
jgi:transcriptional regulator with XRE-family HTH domain